MPSLLVHGWWNIAGAKMSKSLGNIIDPDQLAVHLVGLSDGVALHAMLDPEVLGLVSLDPGLVPRWLAATWQLNKAASA